jgi:ribonucleoside-diphosphate reductase beta chain
MYLKNNDIEKRYSLFPITHSDLWKKYKEVVSQTWVPEEIDLSKDRYDELKENEKIYLNNILAFFTISDGLVIDNLAINFLNEVDILEAQYFYTHQAFIEQVHAETYSLLIDTYIKNLTEKDKLFNSMNTNEAVTKKSRWAEEWIGHPSFAHRLIAFACVEGISFASVFAGVFWYRSRNLMPGLGGANELILRDETSHYEFALTIFKNYLKDEFKPNNDEIKEIIMSCYEIEKVFVEESMPTGLQGLTKDMMLQYVQYVVDIVLYDFIGEKHFNVSNPLDYMSRIGLSSKNNFFEKRDGEYTRVEIPTTTEGIFDDEF